MFKTFLSLIIVGICLIRTVSYGIYILKNENITGGISVFILAAAVVGLYIALRLT